MKQEDSLIWYDSFKLYFFDINLQGQAKLNSLCAYLQEVAWEHAQQLQLSQHHPPDQDDFWVLSRYLIQVIRYPVQGEIIRIKTWPKGTNRLFAFRDFIIFDQNENQIALATSAWLLLDRQSKRPKNLNQYAALFSRNKELHAIDQELKKLPQVRKKGKAFKINVKYNDLDLYQHTNNIKYIEWILDSFPMPLHQKKQICSFQINYLQETRLHDQILIYQQQIDDCQYCLVGEKESDHSACFRAQVTWQ